MKTMLFATAKSQEPLKHRLSRQMHRHSLSISSLFIHNSHSIRTLFSNSIHSRKTLRHSSGLMFIYTNP